MKQWLREYREGPAFDLYVILLLGGSLMMLPSITKILIWIVVWHLFCIGMWEAGKRV